MTTINVNNTDANEQKDGGMLGNFNFYGFKITAKTMPETCAACPFYLYGMRNDTALCSLTGSDIPTNGPQDKGRAPDCPIIEVPVPHGRLIDADKIEKDIEHYHLSDGKFQYWVEIQPTVIEAEDE